MIFIAKIFTKKSMFLLGFGALMLYVSNQALAPNIFEVLSDPCCDKEVTKAIQELAQRSLLTRLTSKYVLDELKKEYPFIKSVEMRIPASKKARVVVKAFKPLVRIYSSLAGNKEYVVCKNGALFDKRFFDAEYTVNLPLIIIEGSDYEEKIKDPQVTACVLSLSNELFEKFLITWHSKSEILLQSRDTKSILRADVHTINDKERYASIERILRSEPEKYSDGIKADIRLSDSLVCSPL